MKPRKILTRKQAIIEASKFFLSEPYPENFDKMTLPKLYEFIDEKSVDQDAYDIKELVEAAAETLLEIVSEYSHGED